MRKHTLLGLLALLLCLMLLALGPALFAAHVHAGATAPAVRERSLPATLPHGCPLMRTTQSHSCTAR